MRFVALLFALFLPSVASAQYIESQNVVNDHGYITTQVNTAWKSKFAADRYGMEYGVSTWTVTNQNYSEALAGVYMRDSYRSGQVIEADIQIGTETSKSPWRVRYTNFIHDSRVTNLLVYETGGSGVWFLFDGNYDLNSRQGIGYRFEKNVGIGPRVQLKVGKVTVWAVPMAWDPGTSFVVRHGEFGVQFIP